MARTVASINSKVDSGDAAATLEGLKAPSANIRSISDECADAYCKKLGEAKAKKIQDGMRRGVVGVLKVKGRGEGYAFALCPRLQCRDVSHM